MLDLIIQNEDRLPFYELKWRGNSANLLLDEKMTYANTNTLEAVLGSPMNLYIPKVIRALQKERRPSSVDSILNFNNPDLIPQASDLLEVEEDLLVPDSPLQQNKKGMSMITIKILLFQNHIELLQDHCLHVDCSDLTSRSIENWYMKFSKGNG